MMPGAEPWVLVVDDDLAVRSALYNLLSAAGFRVATIGSGPELFEDARLGWACCLVLDLQMPGGSGLDVQARLEREGLDVPVVFLTAHGSVASSVQAMKRGAMDFLEKPVDPAALVEAVRRAIARGADAREQRVRVAAIRARFETLSVREREVLEGLVAGHLHRETAGRLAISERTVKFHRANIMEKMGASSLADLVRMVEQFEARGQPLGP